MKRNPTVLNIRLPVEVKQDIDRIALEMGLQTTTLIRMLLIKYIKETKGE